MKAGQVTRSNAVAGSYERLRSQAALDLSKVRGGFVYGSHLSLLYFSINSRSCSHPSPVRATSNLSFMKATASLIASSGNPAKRTCRSARNISCCQGGKPEVAWQMRKATDFEREAARVTIYELLLKPNSPICFGSMFSRLFSSSTPARTSSARSLKEFKPALPVDAPAPLESKMKAAIPLRRKL